MALEIHSRSTRVYLGGYDLSGYLKSDSSEHTTDTADASTFADTGRRYVAGMHDGSYSADGNWVPTAGAINAAIRAADRLGRNLVPNPGFEVDTAGWAALLSATLTRGVVAGFPHLGSAYLKVDTPGAATGEGVRTDSIPTTLNHEYVAEVWVKAPLGATLGIQLQEVDASGGAVGTTTVNFTGTGVAASDPWTLVRVGKSAFLGIAARIRVVTVTTSQAISFYVDDAGLRDPAAQAVLTTFPAGDAHGSTGEGLSGIESANSVTSEIADLVKTSFALQSGHGVEHLLSLGPLATVTAAGNSASIDNGATSSAGLVAYLQVESATAPDADAIAIQSSPDNSVWTDRLFFDLGQAPFSQRKTALMASSDVVARYLRARWVTSTSIRFSVAVGRKPFNV